MINGKQSKMEENWEIGRREKKDRGKENRILKKNNKINDCPSIKHLRNIERNKMGEHLEPSYNEKKDARKKNKGQMER